MYNVHFYIVKLFNIITFRTFLPILSGSDRDRRHIHSYILNIHTSPSCTEIGAAGHQFLDKMHAEENSISIFIFILFYFMALPLKMLKSCHIVHTTTAMLRRHNQKFVHDDDDDLTEPNQFISIHAVNQIRHRANFERMFFVCKMLLDTIAICIMCIVSE